jgi:protein TonB
MAFVQTHSGKNRTATLAGVVVVHGVALYALVAGLSGILPLPPRIAHNECISCAIPLPPISDPIRKKHAKDHNKLIKSTSSETTTKTADPTAKTDTTATGTGPIIESGGDTGVVEPIKPASFTPRGAAPLGNTAAWAGTDDYPTMDLNLGHEGVTKFTLTIGTDGRVAGCQVTKSSGYRGLDAATCTLIRKRARFTPASDASGAKTVGSYSGSMRWQMPVEG